MRITYRGPYEARVALDPVTVSFAEEAQRADGRGGNELHRQDGVHFADELVADVDGGFRDGASKLHTSRVLSSVLSPSVSFEGGGGRSLP